MPATETSPRAKGADPATREVKLYRDGNDLVFHVYDYIDSWWGVGATDLAAELADADDVENIIVRIDSPGGSAYDGIVMYNRLVQHPAKVIVYIDGQAASAASVIAMAGDEIIMGQATEIMIHNPWAVAGGNADAFLKFASDLRIMESQVADLYARCTGQTPEDIAAMMNEEKVMKADEAVELGFADRVETAVPSRAPVVDIVEGVQNYRTAHMEARAMTSKKDLGKGGARNRSAVAKLAGFTVRQSKRRMTRGRPKTA